MSRINRRSEDEIANQQLAENIIEAENAHDYDRVFSVIAPGAVWHAPVELHGRTRIRQAAAEFYEAFPDHHRSVQSLLAGDAFVVVQWRLRATHRGWWRGRPPTGRPIELDGCSIWEFDDLRLVGGWGFADGVEVLRQVGLAVPAQSGPADAARFLTA